MARPSSATYVTALLQFLQAFNSDDLDACEQFFDPQIEWHTACEYRGRAAVRGMLQSHRERFSLPRARPDDFRANTDHVLMIVCFYEGDPDAPPREQRQPWIVHMNEEGLMQRVIAYPSPAEAARAFEALSAAAPNVHA